MTRLAMATLLLISSLPLTTGQDVPPGLLFERELSNGVTTIDEVIQATEGSTASNSNNRRIHPIQNIYKDNSSIRRTAEDLENEMPYYQTGIRGDPDFRVNYKNHPFERFNGIDDDDAEIDGGLETGGE